MIQLSLINFAAATKFLCQSFIHYIKSFLRSRRYVYSPLLKTANHLQFNSVNSLNREGYFVVDNYFSKLQCQQISNEFAEYINTSPEHLHKNHDIRAYGAEIVIPLAGKFHYDNTLKTIGESILSQKLYCAFTLANWLTAGSMGSSGDGWHRDGYFGQYKALLYLTDVDSANGPFEIIPKSHKLIINFLLIFGGKSQYNQDRYSDSSINSIVRFLGLKPIAITAKAGTLVLFNATCLHRGRPIESSERIALTNYYFPISRSLLSVRRQFWPVIVNPDSHNS